MRFKNVVFDLGNVLIKWDPRNLYRKIFTSQEEMEFFLANICTLKWNGYQDGTRTWQEGCELLIKEYPKYQQQILAFDQRWREMLDGLISESSEILTQIHSQDRIRLFALTNWSSEKWPIALEEFPKTLNKFEGIVVSGHEGVCKPNKKIYDILSDRYDFSPQDSLFIDDSENNTLAAQELGFTTIHFRSGPEFLKQIKELGIIDN